MKFQSNKEYNELKKQAARELEQALTAICLKHLIPSNGVLKAFFDARKEQDGLELYTKYTLSLAI